jgi:hypothetical protein
MIKLHLAATECPRLGCNVLAYPALVMVRLSRRPRPRRYFKPEGTSILGDRAARLRNQSRYSPSDTVAQKGLVHDKFASDVRRNGERVIIVFPVADDEDKSNNNAKTFGTKHVCSSLDGLVCTSL